jgi:hypothetical protein
MYIFLLLIGIIALGAGLYIDRKGVEIDLEAKVETGVETGVKPLVDNDFIDRLERLEAIVYSSEIELEESETIREEISQAEFESVLERQKDGLKIDNLDITPEMKEKFKLIADLERGVHSLEEVCKLLDMKKGEVLLLKNLYKNY